MIWSALSSEGGCASSPESPRAREEPAALAVAGEAGAGKSTLWRAGVKAAADAGCRVVHSELSATEADSSFAGRSDLLAEVLPGAAVSLGLSPGIGQARAHM